MLEIVDGFGMASDAALKLRFDAKISCIKEEAEKSSYNQAYDQFVAKSGELHQEEATNILKNAPEITKGVVDQYGLLHAALFAIQATLISPSRG